MVAGFSFSKIIIIESLKPNEFNSADMLHGYIQCQLEDTQLGVTVEIVHCDSGAEFAQLVQRLKVAALELGVWPVLHLECHGDSATGVEFSDGSELSWNEVAEILVELNFATRFNLLAVFAACFGFHFVKEISAITPSPCWCVVGPTDGVMPDEVARGFRSFYGNLLRHLDVAPALKALASEKLEAGKWLVQTAELWYQRIATDYISDHCSLTQTTRRAKQIRKELLKNGVKKSIPEIEAILRRQTTKDLVSKYFETFFMISDVPEGMERFSHAKERLKTKINEMKATGKFGLASVDS
jgi:hypothetical protein